MRVKIQNNCFMYRSNDGGADKVKQFEIFTKLIKKIYSNIFCDNNCESCDNKDYNFIT